MRIPLGDGNPGIPLSRLPEEIRARTWFVRAWDSGAIPERDFELFGGAVVMIEGMLYHYRSFAANHQKLAGFIAAIRKQHRKGPAAMFMSGGDTLRGLTAKERIAARACAHEAIAYINRLGQFYYFAKSARIGGAKDLRRITELMPVRMKFTAHRSIDAPRGEDENTLRNQAFAFATTHYSGQGIVFEFYADDGPFNFRLQEEHPIIMKECFAVLRHFYPLPKRANQ